MPQCGRPGAAARAGGRAAPHDPAPPRPAPKHTHTHRQKAYFMPWACGHERHVYEKCQYKEWKRRVAIMAEEKRRLRDSAIGAAA